VFSGNFPRQLWYSQLYFVNLLGQKSDKTVNISKTNGIKPDLDLSIVIKYYSSFAISPTTAATPAHGANEDKTGLSSDVYKVIKVSRVAMLIIRKGWTWHT